MAAREALTSFVGRDHDLDALDGLVAGARLVSVLGPPGVGKTRLAAEYFRRQRSAFAGRRWFCELAAADSGPAVVTSLARLLELTLGSGSPADAPAARVGAALAELGPALIVLDEIEHLASDADATLGAWMRAAPEVRFVVTSRVRLGLAGEVVLDVRPLSSSAAFQLFVDRARAVRSDLVLAPETEREIADLVRELEGLPLAIELCAARARVMSPAQLSARIAHSYELLRRDVSGKLGGLWGAIESSWELLSPTERQALAACSVFRGSFDLEAAEAVIAPLCEPGGPGALDLLQLLVDSSLVAVYGGNIAPQSADRLARENRFVLYAVIRDFAAGKLAAGEPDRHLRRHAEHYASVGRQWADRVRRHGSIVALEELARERNNLLAAHEWAIGHGDAPLAVELAVAVQPLLLAHGPLDLCVDLLAAALALPADSISPPLRARALEAQLLVQFHRSDPPARRAACDEGLAIATELGDRQLEAIMREQLGWLYQGQGDLDGAQREMEQSLDLFRGRGDRRDQGRLHAALGEMCALREQYRDARHSYERALDCLRGTGDRLSEGAALLGLGWTLLESGELAEARDAVDTAVEILEQARDRRRIAYAAGFRAFIDQEQGRFADARAGFEQAIEANRALGVRRVADAFTGYLASCMLEEGDARHAVAVFERALPVLDELQSDRLPLFLAHAAAARAIAGDLGGARTALERATDQVAARPGSGFVREVVAIMGAVVDLRLAAAAATDAVTGAALRAAALERHRAAPASRSQSDIRFARRLLARELEVGGVVEASRVVEAETAAAPPRVASLPPVPSDLVGELPRDALALARTGVWFRVPGGQLVKLHRRRSLRGILEALVSSRERTPTAAVSVASVVAAGWPGERILSEAAADRAYTAVATLRRMGLRGLLLSTDEGYILAPDVPIWVVDDTMGVHGAAPRT